MGLILYSGGDYMKTIKISASLERDIIAFCDDELAYHINGSGCVNEYKKEIRAQIRLLQLLGEKEKAERFNEQFKEAMGRR